MLHHADLYRLERTTEVADLALEELADDGGIVLVEWGDVVEALFGDHLDVHLEVELDGDETSAGSHRDLCDRIDLGVALESARRCLRGLRVLILGIETATERVSVAVGGHEGVIGLFEVTKGRRHVETLVPAIEFMLPPGRHRPRRDQRGRRRCRARPVHRHARRARRRRRRIAQALRIPMIGISSLDLLAFPNRHTDRVVVPVIDARKGEVFYAMYRQVPGGVQQVAEPTVGSVDDLIADLLARSQDVLCVGDGALRYRDEILDGYRCEIGGDAHPSAAPLVQLAHARALREDWVNPWEIEPVYLRAPDAQINWSTRAGR